MLRIHTSVEQLGGYVGYLTSFSMGTVLVWIRSKIKCTIELNIKKMILI